MQVVPYKVVPYKDAEKALAGVPILLRGLYAADWRSWCVAMATQGCSQAVRIRPPCIRVDVRSTVYNGERGWGYVCPARTGHTIEGPTALISFSHLPGVDFHPQQKIHKGLSFLRCEANHKLFIPKGSKRIHLVLYCERLSRHIDTNRAPV